MEWGICYLTMLLILPTTENCKNAGQRHIVLSYRSTSQCVPLNYHIDLKDLLVGSFHTTATSQRPSVEPTSP
jgi:hypothetical protein